MVLISKFFSSISKQIDSSWTDFFHQGILKCLINIESSITSPYVPLENEVLRFAKTDLNNIKVVIFGRDPYPGVLDDGKPIATGRAFEVRNYNSWDVPISNRSFTNILKSLYASKNEITQVDEIRKSIKKDEFKISPPNIWFEKIESQGVLWLNTALTCEMNGDFGSHENLWKSFSCELVKYIHQNNNGIIYVLWGEAKKLESLLQDLGVRSDKIIKSDHPSSPNQSKENSFLNRNFMSEINCIDWHV